MPSTPYAGRTRFGLLPEPESNPGSFITSCIVNAVILALLLVFGTVAHHEIQLRHMESTEIYLPTTPLPAQDQGEDASAAQGRAEAGAGEAGAAEDPRCRGLSRSPSRSRCLR